MLLKSLEQMQKYILSLPFNKHGDQISKKNLARPIAGANTEKPLREVEKLIKDKKGKQRLSEKDTAKFVGPSYEILGGSKIQIHNYTDKKNSILDKNKFDQSGKKELYTLEKKLSSPKIEVNKRSTVEGYKDSSKLVPKPDTQKEIKTEARTEKKSIDSSIRQDKKGFGDKFMKDVKPRSEISGKKLKK